MKRVDLNFKGNLAQAHFIQSEAGSNDAQTLRQILHSCTTDIFTGAIVTDEAIEILAAYRRYCCAHVVDLGGDCGHGPTGPINCTSKENCRLVPGKAGP